MYRLTILKLNRFNIILTETTPMQYELYFIIIILQKTCYKKNTEWYFNLYDKKDLN